MATWEVRVELIRSAGSSVANDLQGISLVRHVNSSLGTMDNETIPRSFRAFHRPIDTRR